ncbi:MAG: undecaprenyldiphospho-muramoylpentapeptide beta-N-acetylglucosaminyltransferase [Pseudomonadota bacterium]
MSDLRRAPLYPPRTLLVMAGGTGGHIFPAIAVAEHLKEAGWHIAWLGNPDGMEARRVPQLGYQMVWVRFAALRGKGLMRKLMLPVNLLRGFVQAAKAIREVKPSAVLGMGGYITFPGGVMARLLGRPLVVHEQNSIAGMANRVLARLSRRSLCGFPNALPDSAWVGNPVRSDIAALPAPAARFAGRSGPLRLLVVGGSLGAKVLNDTLPQGLALIPPELRPEVIHQSGEQHLAALAANYAAAGVKAECVAFIEDMAKAYAWADLVLCRAGALTVAELAAAGVASILVPFPFAVDDHQTGNARFLSQAGAAFLLPQPQLTPEAIALIRNYARPQLLQMAEQARALARADATARVAQTCIEVAQ